MADIKVIKAGSSTGPKVKITGGKKKAKKKEKRWLGALVQDIEDFGRGLGPGVAAIGKAIVNDTDQLLTGSSSNKGFMFDDIGKGIAKDYAKRYKPLFTGDFGGFVDQVAKHPLDFLLDAAGVATLGTGTLVSGSVKGADLAAKTAARAGRVVDVAQPRGAFKAGGFVPRTSENVAAAERVYGKASKELRVGKEAGVVRGVRTVGQGGLQLERVAKMNPLLRKRDVGVDKVLGSDKLARVPGIGIESRAMREDVRRPMLRADVRRKRMIATPARKLRALKPDAQAAWFFHHTGSNPAEYATALKRRLDAGDLNDRDKLVLEATIERISKPEVVKLYEKPTPAITAAVRETRRLADDDMPELLQGLTKMTHRDLLSRRLLQDRVIEGGELVDTHPDQLSVRDDAVRNVAIGTQGAAVALRDGPVPANVPGRGPGAPATEEAVTDLLSAEERKLIGGRYKVARGALKRYLAAFYDDVRYGGKPDAATVRGDARLQQSAKARARRSMPAQGASRADVLTALEKHGPWDRRVVRMVQDAGGNMRRELWSVVRDARRGAARQLEDRFPPDTLEAKLADAGYNPTDPLANLADDAGMIDVVEEWLDEATGGQGVIDTATRGAQMQMDAGDDTGGWMDAEYAKSLIDEAQRLDGDLDDVIDDYDIASLLASKYQPLSEPHSMPSRAEFVDRVFDAVMRTYVDGPDAIDAGAELGKIRGSAARPLAERLGIRDGEMGIEPSGQDWARAFEAIARQAGFDDQYRFDAKALRGAKQRFETEGVDAFDQVFDPVKLTDRQGKPREARVNPATGRLYEDEDLEMPIEELEALAEGKSFFPHQRNDKGGVKAGSAAVNGTVKRTPKLRVKQSTGRAFETGNFSMDPMMLIQEATKLSRGRQAADLYDAAVLRGVDFDEAVFNETGGSKRWVVLDKRGHAKLAERLNAMEKNIDQVADVLGQERATEMIERLRTMQSATDDLVKGGGDELTMVPRGYFEKLAGDMRESSKLAQAVFDRPLDVFRTLVLFATGRYYVNNIVGQGMLLAVHEGGPQFIPAYIRFVAQRGQMGAARKMLGDAVNDLDTDAALWDRVLSKHAVELEGSSQYDVEMRPGVNSMRQGMAMSDSMRKRAFARALSIPDEANRIGALLSDDLPRQFRFVRLVQPHVKAARAAGMKGKDAEIAMRLLDEDEVLRANIIDRVLGDLIDYRNMSHAERVYVRRFIPFYGWLRGISTWTAELGYNNPEKLLALAQISEIGQRENATWNEQVPEWLAGAVRVGDEKNGLQRVVNTQGLNPLSTISDLAAIGQGLVADKADRTTAGGMVLGQINPFARAALAAINGGRDIGSGMPMMTPGQSLSGSSVKEQGIPGLAASAAVGWLATTPQAMLLTQFRTARDNQETYGTPGSPSAVYQSPWADYVKSYMGMPVRNVNVDAARNRRERDDALLAGEGRMFG